MGADIIAPNPPQIKVGTDIVKISRIQLSIDRFGDDILNRFLTKGEKIAAKNIKSIAGIWAAKEATSKALGCGIGLECGFMDIEITKDKKGTPKINLSQKVLDNFKVSSSSLSISHDGEYAIAVVALAVQS